MGSRQNKWTRLCQLFGLIHSDPFTSKHLLRGAKTKAAGKMTCKFREQAENHKTTCAVRGQETKWEMSDYTKTQPLPANPARWTYKGIYRLNDAQVGIWSLPVCVIVQA